MAKHSAIASGEHFIEKFARHALAASPDEFSDRAYRQAELLLLDTIGCGVAGAGEPTARAVVAMIAESGGAPHCTVIGEPWKTGAPQAVLANGMLMRTLDMNDYVAATESGEFGGHPSDNICVALAAAELADASGRDMLAAIAVGYETYGRAVALMQRSGAWDSVSVSGLAAPAMAGRLLRLDATHLAHALSLSILRTATSALARVSDVSSAKSLANPLVAQNAMQACLLARAGATGPMPLFEDARGMQTVFPHAAALDALLAPFGAARTLMAASIKDYPCLATGQTVVAAGLEAHRRFAVAPDGIESIDIVMADTRQIRGHLADESRNDPRSREAADHSYQFLFAAAFIDGDFGLAQFDKQMWNDAPVRGLIARTRLACDADIQSIAPGGFPCRVTLRARTGETDVVEIRRPPGFSQDGLDEAAIIAKFERLATPHIPPARRARIVEKCLRARELASIRELTALLGA